MPNPPKNDTPDKALVPLHSCPPGLFRFGEVLGFKTEYGMTVCDENGAEMPGHLVRFKISNYPDAYVLESGETFWGGAKSHAERSELLVEPVNLAALSQPQHGGLVEAARWLLSEIDAGNDREHIVSASGPLRAALASNIPVGEDACTCQRHPTHCANDCPQHGLSEPTYTAGERVDVPPTPADTADAFREDNGDKDGRTKVKVDWYENRHKLTEGMVFIDDQGSRVMLDRRVPGDGTRWYVANWWSGSWAFMDSTAEPGDLAELIADNDHTGHCRHCGRDNQGHPSDPCSDDCPIFADFIR